MLFKINFFVWSVTFSCRNCESYFQLICSRRPSLAWIIFYYLLFFSILLGFSSHGGWRTLTRWPLFLLPPLTLLISQRQQEQTRGCETPAFYMSSLQECQWRCDVQSDPDNGDCKLFNYCQDKKLCQLSFCTSTSKGGGIKKNVLMEICRPFVCILILNLDWETRRIKWTLPELLGPVFHFNIALSRKREAYQI